MQSEGKRYFSMNSTLLKRKFISLVDAHRQRWACTPHAVQSLTHHHHAPQYKLSGERKCSCMPLVYQGEWRCVHQEEHVRPAGDFPCLTRHALRRQRIQERLRAPNTPTRKTYLLLSFFNITPLFKLKSPSSFGCKRQTEAG